MISVDIGKNKIPSETPGPWSNIIGECCDYIDYCDKWSPIVLISLHVLLHSNYFYHFTVQSPGKWEEMDQVDINIIASWSRVWTWFGSPQCPDPTMIRSSHCDPIHFLYISRHWWQYDASMMSSSRLGWWTSEKHNVGTTTTSACSRANTFITSRLCAQHDDNGGRPSKSLLLICARTCLHLLPLLSIVKRKSPIHHCPLYNNDHDHLPSNFYPGTAPSIIRLRLRGFFSLSQWPQRSASRTLPMLDTTHHRSSGAACIHIFFIFNDQFRVTVSLSRFNTTINWYV